ncbi:MAG: haloacid dehalogenase-like hydrolase [Candidatus Magasanikbacteria bacterium]
MAKTIKKLLKNFLVLDLDGTFVRWSLFLYLIDELVLMGVFKRSIYNEFSDEYRAWDGRERDGYYEAYINATVRSFAPHIKGVSKKIMLRAAKRVVAKHGHQIYGFTRELVEKAQLQGRVVIALSQSPSEVVGEFCKHWGIKYWCGTTYHTAPRRGKGECYTGVCQVPDKNLELKALVTKLQLTYTRSIGVGDTLGDRSFLKLVEKPICYNPSSALMRYARRKGWLRVYERKDVRIIFSHKGGREVCAL